MAPDDDRFVFSLCAFIRQRDWMYAVISAIVLAVLRVGLSAAPTLSR